MLSTLKTFFEDIAQDLCSFIIAAGIFKLFYWWTQRNQSKLPRPLGKKLASDLSASSASDTDRSAYQARNRNSTGSRSKTTAEHIHRRPMQRSTGSESEHASQGTKNPQAAAFVPSTSPVGAAPQNPQKVQQSVKRCKEVLEAWETKQRTVDDDAMTHLQDAIAGLAPQDAAMMHALLDAKAAEGDGMRQHGPESGRAFRPFDNRPWNCDRHHHDRRDQSRRSGSRYNCDRDEQQQRAKESESTGDSLRENLLELASLDAGSVVMVRKINQIGLDSPAVLEKHFSQFGTIDRVMVAHCVAKRPDGATRLRPAALGFLVMSKVEEAQAVLAAGEVQTVQGVNITVGSFESHDV